MPELDIKNFSRRLHNACRRAEENGYIISPGLPDSGFNCCCPLGALIDPEVAAYPIDADLIVAEKDIGIDPNNALTFALAFDADFLDEEITLFKKDPIFILGLKFRKRAEKNGWARTRETKRQLKEYIKTNPQKVDYSK